MHMQQDFAPFQNYGKNILSSSDCYVGYDVLLSTGPTATCTTPISRSHESAPKSRPIKRWLQQTNGDITLYTCSEMYLNIQIQLNMDSQALLLIFLLFHWSLSLVPGCYAL